MEDDIVRLYVADISLLSIDGRDGVRCGLSQGLVLKKHSSCLGFPEFIVVVAPHGQMSFD